MPFLWRHSGDTACLETGKTLNFVIPLCNFTEHRSRRYDDGFGREGGLLASRKGNRSMSGFFQVNRLGGRLVHSDVGGGFKHS